MIFIINDFSCGSKVEKVIPIAQRREFTWTETSGTKKNPITTDQIREMPYIELETIDELLRLMQGYGVNVQIRQPRENFPYWVLLTDSPRGNFHQR